MRNFLAILEKELKSYFYSPVAYVVLGFFVVATGLFFYNIINWFDRISMQSMMMAQRYGQMQPVNVNMMAIRPLFHNIAIIALFLLPGLTMRLFAEEKRQGTMELLATSPLTNWQITLGKFTSALLFYLVMLLVTGVFITLLFFFGNPEVWPILSGYLGLLLVGGCFISLGLLFSAFTENQIIAFVSAFAVNLAILALGWLSNFTGPTLAQFFSSISPIEHFDDFAKGIIDTKHLVFYLSFMFAGIFLTYVTVESARWRGTR
ncbi:MAG: ABC transporter permease subunit [candidate division KSB1 bacterium]|nr:ABC transporter permease subunit [candidate division KSB1 bacterium]MDZ7303487.1 ABC transporter permease subunit [candidate division KSB1 bacterium]MDZ7312711.1 ABC transporter permease subunit [candidate division KSB1 bacterium]